MIRILLVDDQLIIRQGLKALLELEPDLKVVGSADNGKAAIELVETLQPDVVLIDILMPEMDGVTATQIICQRNAEIKVLVLSGSDNDQHLADALRAGARGYLLKNTPSEELADAIRSVQKGYAQIGPGLFDKIPFKAPPSNSVKPGKVSLTPLSVYVLPQLKSFDIKALKEVVSLAIEMNTAVELFSQVEQQLQQDPNNLAALYLAGSITARNGGDKMLALHYLRMGFREAAKQGLSREDLLLFYHEGALLQPEEAFNWLIQFDGFWNSKEGFALLLKAAEKASEPNSPYCRTLLALRQIRAMRSFSNSCASLKPMIEVLDKGFERFSKLPHV